MSQLFGHEKLIVYQKAIRFAVIRSELLGRLSRQVVACDHLYRGAESISVNIAHASSTWSPKERIVYLGHANGSALECAACLDVLVAKKLLTNEDVYTGKSLLAKVVSILLAMRKTAANRIFEDIAAYRTDKGRWFSHEDLDVYQASLQLVALLESMLMQFLCSADIRSKLDKFTTTIVLNIAEGSGRFTDTDQKSFYKIAYKATIQTAALVDMASTNGDASCIEDGRKLIRRIAAMLTALSRV